MKPARCLSLLLLSATPLLGSHAPQAEPVAAVRLAYQREHNESIDHPAIYSSPQTTNCVGQLTTTAYLRTSPTTSTLLSMYLSSDGTSVTRKRTDRVMTPAGTWRMLVVLLAHPETVGSDALTLWERAQHQINQDHADFAASRGYDAPIVVFDSTNLRIDPARIKDPRDPRSVRAVVQELGVEVDGYRLIATLDLNPAVSAGGFSDTVNRAIYMGNYSRWTAAPSAAQWQNVANAIYHHEVAHHWGWPGSHDWVKGCRGVNADYKPFIAPPILFGWEDVDGDGVPEILSDTPYGRKERGFDLRFGR